MPAAAIQQTESEPTYDQLLKQRDQLAKAVQHYVDREHRLPSRDRSDCHYLHLALLASCRGNLL